jgi:hypothetical protein
MNFDRGGQNLLAQRGRALFISQGLQEEFDCLADIDKCLFDRLALRLAPLQFWAPRVAALLVLFNYDANLARHQPLCYRQQRDDRMCGAIKAQPGRKKGYTQPWARDWPPLVACRAMGDALWRSRLGVGRFAAKPFMPGRERN